MKNHTSYIWPWELYANGLWIVQRCIVTPVRISLFNRQTKLILHGFVHWILIPHRQSNTAVYPMATKPKNTARLCFYVVPTIVLVPSMTNVTWIASVIITNFMPWFVSICVPGVGGMTDSSRENIWWMAYRTFWKMSFQSQIVAHTCDTCVHGFMNFAESSRILWNKPK